MGGLAGPGLGSEFSELESESVNSELVKHDVYSLTTEGPKPMTATLFAKLLKSVDFVQKQAVLAPVTERDDCILAEDAEESNRHVRRVGAVASTSYVSAYTDAASVLGVGARRALVDTGAAVNLISTDYIQQLRSSKPRETVQLRSRFDRPLTIRGIDGSALPKASTY